MYNRIKWLALATSIGMVFVLLGGALVTKTDSGAGCGDTSGWPLCNGKFIPAYTIESMFEYSHRLVSGITGLLVLMTVIIVFWKFRQRKDAVLYSSIALFFTIVQAYMGALAAGGEQHNLIMALHFGFSIIAFTATILLLIVIWRFDRPAHHTGWGEQGIMEGTGVSPSFRKLVWFTTIYSYIVIYGGAYVRHSESTAGCQGWPLCNGELIPSLSGPTGVAFFHRIVALSLVILVVYLFVKGWREYKSIPEIRKSGLLVAVLTSLQVFSGAFVVFTMTNANLYVFASLLHTILVAGMFSILSYMSVLVWQMNIKGKGSADGRDAFR